MTALGAKYALYSVLLQEVLILLQGKTNLDTPACTYSLEIDWLM